MNGSFHQLDQSATLIAEIVYGDDSQYVEETVPLGTTLPAFVEYLSMTTPVLPAGTYRIGWVFQYEASTAATEGEYQLTIDDVVVPTVDTETLTVASAGERKSYANMSFEITLAGSHQIDLDIRRSSGAGTFTIDDAKIEIWRVV